MTTEAQPVAPERFMSWAFVGVDNTGPLYVTTGEPGAMQIVGFTTGGAKVLARLMAGEALQTIIEGTWEINRTLTRIPVHDLADISWVDGKNELTCRYHLGTKELTAITYVPNPGVREQLLDWIQSQTACSLRIEREPAGFLRVAWANVVGAMLAASGTVWMYSNWDPVAIGRVRNGALALLLGRNGCAAVGTIVFVCCCVAGWKSLKTHYWMNRCVLEEKASGLAAG